MSTIGDVRKYIEGTYDETIISKTFSEIAENFKIQSEIECYDYDKIKRQIMGDRCASADALYLKRFIYFIEFKTGFATEKTDANTRTHLENLKLRIKIKAYEDILQEASGNTVKNKEELKKLYLDSLLNYRKSAPNGKYVFYNGIDVW